MDTSRSVIVSCTAESTVVANQAVALGTVTTGKLYVAAAGSGVRAFGIAQTAAAAGEQVDVIVLGPSLATAGAVLSTPYTSLKVGATAGKLVAVDGNNDKIVAFNIETSTADGDNIWVVVAPVVHGQ